MPIKKTKSGYKWGKSGKTYPTKAGAVKQMKAIYASGYKKSDIINSYNNKKLLKWIRG